MVLLIFGLILIALGIAMIFVPRLPGAISAFAGMCLCYFSGYDPHISVYSLVFWGLAAVVATGIYYMLPQQVARSTYGVSYIGVGSVAGAFLGMVYPSVAAITIGSALGAFFGALAFSRTRAGADMAFPSGKFVNYLCAKGLPAVVICSIAAIVCAQLIIFHSVVVK